MKNYFKQNHLKLFELVVIIFSASIIGKQLYENSTQNKVSIRGQLYETESFFQKEGREDDDLNYLWLKVNDSVKGLDFSRTLLSCITTDSSAINSKTVKDLYSAVWEIKTNGKEKYSTQKLRKIYLYSQAYLYHIHNAFDYKNEGILNSEEWKTWKGLIRETSANPIFILAIYQGYKYNYFSEDFAIFLQSELCSEKPDGLNGYVDSLEYYRNKEFIEEFYPEIFMKCWPYRMPKY